MPRSAASPSGRPRPTEARAHTDGVGGAVSGRGGGRARLSSRSPARPPQEGSVIAHHDPRASGDAAAPQLDLTLHIGTGKTGTTSLQSFLDLNRPRLAEAGWLYPRSLGRTRHAQFGLWTRPEHELEVAFRGRRPGTRAYDDVEHLRREMPRRLLAEVQRTGLTRVLISDEGLYGSSASSLERLRQLTDRHASRLRLVCYLRRQDDHLVSRYQQVVKVRETRTLADRVAEMDLSGVYDYHARLQSWLRIVEPDELVIRLFERDRFRGGSLYADFVDAAGLGIPAQDLPPRNRNESLDAESVEFLRLVNLFREEHGDTDMPPNGRLVPRLSRLGTGPTLTLPVADLDRFMARWAESNERVARELLGTPNGSLFSASRKDSGTTTEQRLDPARLDVYVETLELPDQVVAPLRRIAEREAAR